MSIIQTTNLHKYYDNLHVLKGVNVYPDKSRTQNSVDRQGGEGSFLMNTLVFEQAHSNGQANWPISRAEFQTDLLGGSSRS